MYIILAALRGLNVKGVPSKTLGRSTLNKFVGQNVCFIGKLRMPCLEWSLFPSILRLLTENKQNVGCDFTSAIN